MSTKDVYALFEQARKVYNPFKLDIVAAEEVWGEVITDLPSLNQHIDQTIFSAISEIQRKDCNKISITIKGDRGTGKSHVIHRVWKKITQDGGAVFSYIAPYTNPRRINSHVRFHLAESFKRRNIQGDTQWQKLAAAAIRTLKGTDSENKYQPYIERCDSPNTLRKYILDNQNKDTLGEFFNELIEAILENQTGTDLIDYNFLKATLFLILGQVRLAQIAYIGILFDF